MYMLTVPLLVDGFSVVLDPLSVQPEQPVPLSAIPLRNRHRAPIADLLARSYRSSADSAAGLRCNFLLAAESVLVCMDITHWPQVG